MQAHCHPTSCNCQGFTCWCTACRGHTDSVNDVCWQPFSGNVCSASADNSVCVWDARSGLPVLKLYGHEGTCNRAAFNPQASPGAVVAFMQLAHFG